MVSFDARRLCRRPAYARRPPIALGGNTGKQDGSGFADERALPNRPSWPNAGLRGFRPQPARARHRRGRRRGADLGPAIGRVAAVGRGRADGRRRHRSPLRRRRPRPDAARAAHEAIRDRRARAQARAHAHGADRAALQSASGRRRRLRTRDPRLGHCVRRQPGAGHAGRRSTHGNAPAPCARSAR